VNQAALICVLLRNAVFGTATFRDAPSTWLGVIHGSTFLDLNAWFALLLLQGRTFEQILSITTNLSKAVSRDTNVWAGGGRDWFRSSSSYQTQVVGGQFQTFGPVTIPRYVIVGMEVRFRFEYVVQAGALPCNPTITVDWGGTAGQVINVGPLLAFATATVRVEATAILSSVGQLKLLGMDVAIGAVRSQIPGVGIAAVYNELVDLPINVTIDFGVADAANITSNDQMSVDVMFTAN
jgi:hypothetical protein